MNKALPSTWSQKPLGEVAEIVSGGTPSRAIPEFWGGSIAWATPSDITETAGRHIFDTREHITELGLRSSSAKLLPSKSLLMTSRATLGEVRIATNPISTNQGFKSLVPRQGIDPRFLFYQIQLHKERYKALGIGSTFLEVNKRDTERFQLPFPPEREQFDIAEVLTTVDELIERTELQIAKLEKINWGMIQGLLTRGVMPDGTLRPPRSEAANLYKTTALGWIPKAWQVDKLGNYIGAIDSGWSPTCLREPVGADEWGVLKTTAVIWDGYTPTENKRLPTELFPDPTIETKQGDILITRKGPVERVGVVVHVEDTPPKLMFPDTVFRTRLTSRNSFTPRFMAYVLGSSSVQKYWWQRKIGLADAQVNLNHGILRSTPIPLIDAKEQEQICIEITRMKKRLEISRGRARKLDMLKVGLMQDLLTGRVRVPGKMVS